LPSKYRCSLTQEKIKGGREAEHCEHYKYSEYDALEWASRIDIRLFKVLNKEGQVIQAINAKEKMEEIEASWYSDPDFLPY
jgi:hypothetical protein